MVEVRDNAAASLPCAPRLGCDLTDVTAIEESISIFGDRYLRRVYSATERAQSGELPERLAARFAGKEAVLKVLRRTAGITYSQIEILTDVDGAPVVRLTATAAHVAADQHLGPIAISLSHERGFALAAAMAMPAASQP